MSRCSTLKIEQTLTVFGVLVMLIGFAVFGVESIPWVVNGVPKMPLSILIIVAFGLLLFVPGYIRCRRLEKDELPTISRLVSGLQLVAFLLLIALAISFFEFDYPPEMVLVRSLGLFHIVVLGPIASIGMGMTQFQTLASLRRFACQ